MHKNTHEVYVYCVNDRPLTEGGFPYVIQCLGNDCKGKESAKLKRPEGMQPERWEQRLAEFRFAHPSSDVIQGEEDDLVSTFVDEYDVINRVS